MNHIYLFAFFIILSSSSCKKKAPEFTNTSGPLNLISFNLRYDTSEDGKNQWNNRKEAVITMFQDKNPDIFGIQEGLINQVEYLETKLPEYSRVGVGRDDGYTRGEFAAIFFRNDKFIKIDEGNFWLSETPEYPSLGWDANNIRIVTWIKLKNINFDTPFYVFNTHFDHKGKTARKESGKLLKNKIQEITNNEDVPIFAVGDFNAVISNSILKPIHEILFESRCQAKESSKKATFNSWGKWNSKIDFIFYRGMNIKKFDVIRKDYGVKYISDHYPIQSIFE